MYSYLPSEASSYLWFFYLGIFLFVTHIGLYGFGLDLSYFGLLLIWIGWARPVLHVWFRWVIWIFIFLDIYATLRVFRERMLLNLSTPSSTSSKKEKEKDKKDKKD